MTPGFTGFIYHKRAIGFGVGLDLKTSVDWIPIKQSWLSVGNMKGGAVIIDPEGIVKLIYSETVIGA